MSAVEPPSGTERAVVGLDSRDAIDGWVDGALRGAVGSGAAEFLFRSGRIDAVYGVHTDDGRRLVLKVHRPPVDLAGRGTTATAQRALVAAGFPVPVPVAGPLSIDGRVVSVETLLDGGAEPAGHDPALRRAVARGLAEHIAILRRVPGLAAAVSSPPAWYRYAGGPWPQPHDSIFDFRITPPGYEWLDDVARAAADRLRAARRDQELVAAHADWCYGNLRYAGSTLVAALDWDLVADDVAVVAGLTAGMFSAGSVEDGAVPTPQQVAEFLQDVEHSDGCRFTAVQQRQAAAAATWSLSYNARCQICFEPGEPAASSALGALLHRKAEYLDLTW